MHEPFSRRLTILSYTAGVTTAFLLCILGFQQWDIARWEASHQLEQQRSTTRATLIANYLSSLRDIETGQRGYLVTGERAFLQPLERALATLPAQTAAIEKSYNEPGPGKTLAHELLKVGAARIQRAMITVKLTEEGKPAEGRAVVIEGTGKRLMDRARGLAADLGRLELTSSRRREADGRAQRADRQRKIYLTEVATLLSLAALVLALTKLLENLRRNSVTLRDSAARQAAIFDGASDAMMMLDSTGRIESANTATEQLFGYRREELIGRSNLHLFANPPSQEVSQAYLARLANGDSKVNKQDFDGRRSDGRTIAAEVVTTPIELADGLHYLAVARDATERRQIERMKNEFVATVSHELRTPLTSIAGSLGLILGGLTGDLSEKSARLVQIAKNNCDRLIRLINDMLDIEKIESGKSQLNLEAIDVQEAIEQAIGSVDGLASAHQIKIEVSQVRGGLSVMADADRLTQILTNLVSNAVKFSPAGSAVRIGAEISQDSFVEFSVRDEGPGISEEFQHRIFQKFAQADSTDSRSKGGTGLGLSIVKELVVGMGGEVSFSSSPKGTTFTFTLPRSEHSKSSEEMVSSLGRMEEDASLQVLHVDDDADTLRLVASALEGRAVVHSCPSSQEAKAALDRYEFDALVLDLAMPDGDGLELIEFAGGHQGIPVPIVLYTALDAEPGAPIPVFARLTKTKDSLHKLVETVEAAAEQGRADRDD